MSADERPVELKLSLDEAEALHAKLEDLLEGDDPSKSPALNDSHIQRLYRLLGWRILAAKEPAPGLTGRMAEMARKAESLEEFEAARDDALGPILDGLERGENRDP